MRHVHFVVAIALAVLGGTASPALAISPANDARAAATALSPPGGVSGTTAGSTLEGEESLTVQGESVSGSVWYTFHTSQARRVVLRLAAAGNLDAGLEVYRRARSQLKQERVPADRRERPGGHHLRLAWRRDVPGARRPARQLGAGRLPARRLSAAAVPARAGRAAAEGRGVRAGRWARSTLRTPTARSCAQATTYRVNLANLSSHRLVLSVFAPGTTSFQSDSPIRSGKSYVLITPGVDEGGRYSFVVSASRVTSRQAYRLQAGLGRARRPVPGHRCCRTASACAAR